MNMWKKWLWVALVIGLVLVGFPLVARGAQETSNKVEVFSWLTTGGEATGLAAVINVAGTMYPEMEVINSTVAGGGGDQFKAVLVTRMFGEDAPDTFMVQAGGALIETWVKTGFLEPVTGLFKEEGWLDVMPSNLIDLLSYNGEIWSVPVYINRINNIWYNTNVFAKYGITKLPDTYDELFVLLDKMKADGLVPVAMGTLRGYEITQNFEAILASMMTVDEYVGLWNGKTSWINPKVAKSLEIQKKMMTYVNADHSSMPWQDAIEYVIDGKAAFLNVQGDWIDGWRSAVNRDLSHIARTAPVGCDTIYLYNTDTFALPKKAPNRENALKMLRVFGSKAGQEAFAPNKGAVPARGDVDLSKFNDYLKGDIIDFNTHDLYPSVAHGVATSESWRASVVEEINLFASTGNVARTQENLQKIATEELARQRQNK